MFLFPPAAFIWADFQTCSLFLNSKTLCGLYNWTSTCFMPATRLTFVVMPSLRFCVWWLYFQAFLCLQGCKHRQAGVLFCVVQDETHNAQMTDTPGRGWKAFVPPFSTYHKRYTVGRSLHPDTTQQSPYRWVRDGWGGSGVSLKPFESKACDHLWTNPVTTSVRITKVL